MGMLLFAFIAPPAAHAETLEVCSGTETNVNVPIYGFYADQESDATIVYPASLLSKMNGSEIKAIKFHAKDNITLAGGTLIVKMGEVNTTTPTSHFETLVQVYSGRPANGSTEYVIQLDEPYTYNGGNLAIECVMSGATNSPNIYFYGLDQSQGTCYVSYGIYGGTVKPEFLPKATFTYEGSGVSVDPTSLSFGGDSFYFGTTETKQVTVTNNTAAAVTTALALSGANAGMFSVGNNVTIAAGQSATIDVTYAPTAAGTHEATLTVVEGKTVALSGQAVTPPTPTIAVNPTTLNFGTVGVNSSNTQTFTVNGSNLTSDITLTASGDYFSVSPTTIAKEAASDVTVTVTYAPTATGTHTGSVRLTSTDADTKTVVVRGTAEAVNYNGTVETENGTLSLDFGTVNIGQTSGKLSIKVTNTGNTAFTPGFSIDNNAFSIEATRSIAAGTPGYFDVTFAPNAVGEATGTLTVTIGEHIFRVSLMGVGHEVPDYAVSYSNEDRYHNFGEVFVNHTGTWSFNITNVGKKAITPAITLSAPYSTDYVSAAVAPGATQQITIKFTPTEITEYYPSTMTLSFAEDASLNREYTLRGKGVEDTGTLPASFYDGIEYTWTDNAGNEKTSNLGEVATDPDQMIALMTKVYTDKRIPGNKTRGYTADGNPEGTVSYPGVGRVVCNENTNYQIRLTNAYGWNIPANNAFKQTTGGKYTYVYPDPEEYMPDEEGVTLLLVEMKDKKDAGDVSGESAYMTTNSYASLRANFANTFKSVRVVTHSKRSGTGASAGTMFKVDCDKMNRFFFLAKGQLRVADQSLGNKHCYNPSWKYETGKSIISTGSFTETGDLSQTVMAPFYHMFEQFSPNVASSTSTAETDIYQNLVNMESYKVLHDCVTVPYIGGHHEFNMYGLDSESEDCQDVRDMIFFVPDRRMTYWKTSYDEARDLVDENYINYYQEHAPTMGLYVIRQNPITGEQKTHEGNANNYELTLTWKSNLLDFLPSAEGSYYIYQVMDDGSYVQVGQTDANTTTLVVNVPMQEHGQQVTYVIQGQDKGKFLSLQMSNEESFIIPGTNVNEKFQFVPNAEYHSRFNPADEHNYYANGMQIKAYPDVLVTDFAGKSIKFSRRAQGAHSWTHVATAAVNQAGTEATVSVENQRDQADYKYGYKENAGTVTITTDNKGFKVFDVIFDNFKEDVSSNTHPDFYVYKAEVEGTDFDSNEMTIRVQKTAMSPIAGVFSKDAVDADTKHTTGLESKSFDIDVTYSSKTDVLRYDAYRWKDSEAIQIIDHTSDPDNEKDLAPQGIAGNQGEFYTVAMNSDYVGEDVPVVHGQTAQVTFVDNIASAEAGAYTFAPVVETFSPEGHYNTYGAPLQHSATGTIGVQVQNISRNGESGMIEQSTYTWTENGQRYAYYNVYLDVNSIEIPEGYDLYKVRAWRKIDPSLLAEELPAYQERMGNGDGECLFEEITSGTDAACKKTGITSYALGSVEKEDVSPVSGKPFKVWGGTFGAKILSQGDEMPMEFTVRAYFTRNANLTSGSSNAPRRAEGDATVTDANGYYITESTVKFTATGSDIITAVTDKSINREVKDVIYYNMTGAVSVRPFDGVNVVVTRYTDGTTSTHKMIK